MSISKRRELSPKLLFFREMRRKKQQLSERDSKDVLLRRTFGVLAVTGDEGYPYAVPLSYVFDEKANKIYFHCAKSGHKLEAVHQEEKVSFCVVDQDEIVPERFTTHYRSVIVFGKIRVIEEGEEWLEAIKKLMARYSPLESEESVQQEIETASQFVILELSIEHMTGKEAIELVRMREKGME